MSTQSKHSKQSLRGKVSNSRSGGDDHLKVPAHSRLPKLNNTNIGQECRCHVDENLMQIINHDPAGIRNPIDGL